MAERIESTGRGNLGVIGFDTAHLARDTARLSYLRQDQFSLIGPCHIIRFFYLPPDSIFGMKNLDNVVQKFAGSRSFTEN